MVVVKNVIAVAINERGKRVLVCFFKGRLKERKARDVDVMVVCFATDVKRRRRTKN